MATSRVVLPIPGGVPPDGSGTINVSARPEKVVSTGTQTTNTPKVSYVQLLLDQSTDQVWMWAFPIPGDYVSGGTVRIKFGAKVTTGNVIFKAGQKAAQDSTDALTTAVFTAADLSAATAVAGTLGQPKEVTIALTATGMAANRQCVVFVGRDADNASDTAAGDAYLLGVVFEYTS